MAAIWKDIEIQWKGETHNVRPTLDLINYLERDEGCSLSNLVIRMFNKDLPSAAACKVIAKTLTFAGCRTSAEEVFEQTNGGIGGDLVAMASVILLACMPQPKTESSEPAKKKASPRPRKR